MSVFKIFECIIFKPEFGCAYTIDGEKEFVIDQGAIHAHSEHGLEDTPELRKEIESTLIST